MVQKTDYPWKGKVEFEISPASPTEFSLFLRKPEWSSHVSVAGKFEATGPAENGYIRIRRRWSPGDKVILELDMTPQLIEANAQVAENNGRAAVQRGPIVYCLEQLDQQKGIAVSEVDQACNGVCALVRMATSASTRQEDGGDREASYRTVVLPN